MDRKCMECWTVQSAALFLLAVCGTQVAHSRHVLGDDRRQEEPPRLSVPFDYGWRFRFGPSADGAPGPGNTNFKNISNQGCTDIEHNPHRMTPTDCMLACAYNPDCFVWLQNSKGRVCYHGTEKSKCSPSTTPTFPAGGQRATVPPLRTTYDNAKKSLDDSDWESLDLPHDFVVAGNFENMSDVHHGFLPRNVSWYRKSFHVPSDWKGSHIMVYFEGVFHVAQIWLNGQYLQMHTCGYTGFTVRLDNVTGLEYGNESTNVLAVRTDATFGSGHWYEGGGIYRRTHIIRTNPARFVHDGVFISPEMDLAENVIRVTAEIDVTGDEKLLVKVIATLYNMNGQVMGSNESYNVSLAQRFPQIVPIVLPGSNVKAWSIQSPTIYTVGVVLKDAFHGNVLDSLNVSAGFRQTDWTVEPGFKLNGHVIKFRGFSHHNSFTGVGVAIPDRIHLFRAQASRAVGGSFWRMSHNPYLPALYDFLDVLGVITWDENRDYALEYVGAMHEMVKRDRGHPSIVVWSYCNEIECVQIYNKTGPQFRHAAKELDPQRPTAANGPTNGLDVQGLSHAQNSSFEAFHQQYPDMPLVLSECCSCQTQRLFRMDTTTCMHDQNSPGLLPYVAGSLGVWTLFDYYGESHNWPSVTSSYGNFDLAGFPKPHAYWYVLNWMVNIELLDKGRPPLPRSHLTRILDLPGYIYNSVAVLSSGAEVELYLNGKSVGQQFTHGSGEPVVFNLGGACIFPVNVSGVFCDGLQKVSGPTTAAECKANCCLSNDCTVWQFSIWKGNPFCFMGNVDTTSACVKPNKIKIGEARSSHPKAGIKELKAVSVDSEGHTIASHVLLGAKEATAIVLTLDVPSPSTGTGKSLVLDGHDAALVRGSVVDENGTLVTQSTVNITFRIISGPARLIGVGNGDNNCHQNAKSDHVPAYGGLARGIFQVTADCVSQNREHILLIDAEHDGQATVYAPGSCTHDTSIVVEGSSPGLKSGSLTIAVSSSPDDLPLNVAREAVQMEDYTYLRDFDG